MILKNGLSEELNRQGNEHFGRGHYTEAYTCYAKALECDRLTGDQRALAATLGNLGIFVPSAAAARRRRIITRKSSNSKKFLAMRRASGQPWPTWEICAQMPGSGTGLEPTTWKPSI